MSIFDRQRLTNETFKLDLDRMRQGWYSDKYFENIMAMLTALAHQNYRYTTTVDHRPHQLDVGNLQVEMQFFTRRPGKTIICGVDKALAMLHGATGYMDEQGFFVNTYDELHVEAVHDGGITRYYGEPREVQPVIRVRGRYRDFALLETPMLGVLTRASRIATNVYETLMAAKGKPVLFFPARFDAHEVQAADGYAYSIAVQRYNADFGKQLAQFVSTDAQGDWWGGYGGGTVAHAAIACFLGDTAAAMMAFAATRPANIPRIALVDFNNDCVGDTMKTLQAMFNCYCELRQAGNEEEARKYVLYGVRLDTGGNLRDASVTPLGDPALDLGVNPRLVFNVRQALDNAVNLISYPSNCADLLRDYARNVKIVVSGGFAPDKIKKFERLGVPSDIYAVGSYLLANDDKTNTDFTADIVRTKLNGDWHVSAKIGRAPADNSELERV